MLPTTIIRNKTARKHCAHEERPRETENTTTHDSSSDMFYCEPSPDIDMLIYEEITSPHNAPWCGFGDSEPIDGEGFPDTSIVKSASPNIDNNRGILDTILESQRKMAMTAVCTYTDAVAVMSNNNNAVVLRAPSDTVATDSKVLIRLSISERMPVSRLIDSSSDPLVGMIGMTDVRKLLVGCVLNPICAFSIYANTLGHITSMNFCIIGRSGTGKHTAIRRACAAWNINILTIRSQKSHYGDLACALNYAMTHRPCLICFDEFDKLLACQQFCEEFRQNVCSNEDLYKQWDRVWLAFCIENYELANSDHMRALCRLRVASVAPFNKLDLAKLFYDEFLCGAGVEIAVPPTEAEWRTLQNAIEGHTPGELKEFAADVIWKALAKRPTNVLAKLAGTPVINFQDAMGASTLPPRLPTEGVIRIDWRVDVESLYIKTGPNMNGITKWTIPTYTVGTFAV